MSAANVLIRSEDALAEESTLWDRFRAERSGDAREKLFGIHMSLARQIAARRFRAHGGADVEFADFYQLACMGLIEAIDRFDPAYGVPFRAYAAKRINGAVLDGLVTLSEAREQISFRTRTKRVRLASLRDGAAEASPQGRFAELAELAVGLAIGFMLEGTSLVRAHEAVDTAPGAYESAAWQQTIATVRREMASLQPRHAKIITLHYDTGLSFERISELLGCSKTRVAQLHQEGVTTLRKRLARDGRGRLTMGSVGG